ncbi:uncharacterized protein BDCG_17827 [Blastomyces dermatitidis ER-3]|uniref:Uncharacterized protein n=1 Tax=Ajellomyces dermatitidis (strain ER-3 / ATCC MYA-2586) TaxID=559297 RepID=A0ABX2W0K0_AJEDR|nr:uncharacterized protein BDCG_17827 [Blastomyces dermatitidis ER-3]OAT02907.1 hypothetical protein BDCG_17827 [Blastomyces dermatitidis ER-3]
MGTVRKRLPARKVRHLGRRSLGYYIFRTLTLISTLSPGERLLILIGLKVPRGVTRLLAQRKTAGTTFLAALSLPVKNLSCRWPAEEIPLPLAEQRPSLRLATGVGTPCDNSHPTLKQSIFKYPTGLILSPTYNFLSERVIHIF